MQGKLPLWWTDHWHTAATFYFVNDKTVVFHNVLRMGMTRTFNFGLVNEVKVLCGSISPYQLCFKTH